MSDQPKMEVFIALCDEGFTEFQALIIVGQMVRPEKTS